MPLGDKSQLVNVCCTGSRRSTGHLSSSGAAPNDSWAASWEPGNGPDFYWELHRLGKSGKRNDMHYSYSFTSFLVRNEKLNRGHGQPGINICYIAFIILYRQSGIP